MVSAVGAKNQNVSPLKKACPSCACEKEEVTSVQLLAQKNIASAGGTSIHTNSVDAQSAITQVLVAVDKIIL
jgi:hypothetical protein